MFNAATRADTTPGSGSSADAASASLSCSGDSTTLATLGCLGCRHGLAAATAALAKASVACWRCCTPSLQFAPAINGELATGGGDPPALERSSLKLYIAAAGLGMVVDAATTDRAAGASWSARKTSVGGTGGWGSGSSSSSTRHLPDSPADTRSSVSSLCNSSPCTFRWCKLVTCRAEHTSNTGAATQLAEQSRVWSGPLLRTSAARPGASTRLYFSSKCRSAEPTGADASADAIRGVQCEVTLLKLALRHTFDALVLPARAQTTRSIPSSVTPQKLMSTSLRESALLRNMHSSCTASSVKFWPDSERDVTRPCALRALASDAAASPSTVFAPGSAACKSHTLESAPPAFNLCTSPAMRAAISLSILSRLPLPAPREAHNKVQK
eukprot:Hpha_TRINITY_DN15188_c1_g16::TRINITY_DN15188_c1_g16_i1::g.128631::m.128631